MNNTRRKALAKLLPDIERIKAELEQLRDEEQDAFDAMPEGLQQSERGQISEDAVSSLDCAVDGLEEAITNISDIL